MTLGTVLLRTEGSLWGWNRIQWPPSVLRGIQTRMILYSVLNWDQVVRTTPLCRNQGQGLRVLEGGSAFSRNLSHHFLYEQPKGCVVISWTQWASHFFLKKFTLRALTLADHRSCRLTHPLPLLAVDLAGACFPGLYVGQVLFPPSLCLWQGEEPGHGLPCRVSSGGQRPLKGLAPPQCSCRRAVASPVWLVHHSPHFGLSVCILRPQEGWTGSQAGSSHS